jgi:LysM repeat protein
MDDKDSILRRYGGHLALLLVAILLFFALTSVPEGDLFNIGLGTSTGEPPVVELPDERIDPLVSAPDDEFEPADLTGVPLLVSNSLSPHLNSITFEGKRPEHSLVTYTVQANDTPIGIALEFEIEPETLLGGNAFLSEEASALHTGDILTILSVDGVLHDVRDGDTLEKLANQYGVSAEEIIAYKPNNLEFPYRLYPETQIMVPGGTREVWFWTAPQAPSRASTSDSTGSGIASLVQGTGTFIWPIGYRRITQAYWYGHPAIDIGVPDGTPLYASDTGTVTWAGWNVYGYGNLIVINHGNGYETYYGHLSGINVYPGQVVNQGQHIGATGNTGRSSGPHLHFEIRYYNSMLQPLAYLR